MSAVAIEKDAIALFGDELELRDKFATSAMESFIATPPTSSTVREAMIRDPLGMVSRMSFDVATAMIIERRRRTFYTCAHCGSAACKEAAERCEICARIKCTRCDRPLGELHHICVRDDVKVAAL